MTDRRERVAMVLNPYPWHPEMLKLKTLDAMRNESLTKADAILAALADDLLPELPEWVMKQTAWSGGTDWKVVLNDYEPQVKDVRRAYGTGPTIPAAIRASLEQDR